MNQRTAQSIAIATTRSFGDFTIAHSVLHRVKEESRRRIRLISCSHVEGLNAILPSDVCVTLVKVDGERVPALFDVRKRGASAAFQSALSLRREFQNIERTEDEILVFDVLGVRERLIAGRWPVTCPRRRLRNIYETYFGFLSDHGIRIAAMELVTHTSAARSVGIFPESRLAEKRLTAATVSLILAQVAQAGLEAKVFILDGDQLPHGHYPCAVNISRTFGSLAGAIASVDSVISADSLPAHLAEYFGRPAFVASPVANEYWLPYRCYVARHWGVFRYEAAFRASLDGFLADIRGAPTSSAASVENTTGEQNDGVQSF